MNTKNDKEYTISKHDGITHYENVDHNLWTLHKDLTYRDMIGILYGLDVNRQKEFITYKRNYCFFKVKDVKSFKFNRQMLTRISRDVLDTDSGYCEKDCHGKLIHLKTITEYNRVPHGIVIYNNTINHMYMGLFNEYIFNIADEQIKRLPNFSNQYYSGYDINHFNTIAECDNACTTISASFERDEYTTIKKKVYFNGSIYNSNYYTDAIETNFDYLCKMVGNEDASVVLDFINDNKDKIDEVLVDNALVGNNGPIIYRTSDTNRVMVTKIIFDYFYFNSDEEFLSYSDLKTLSKHDKRFYKKNARCINIMIGYIDKELLSKTAIGANDEDEPYTEWLISMELIRAGRNNTEMYKTFTINTDTKAKEEKKTLNEAVTSADDKIKTINPDSASIKIKCDLNGNKITCLIIDFPKPERAFTDEEISNILNQWKKMCKCYDAEPTEYACNQVTEVLLDISGRLAIHRHNMSYVTIVYKTSGCYKDCTLINIKTFDGVKMIPITMKYPYLMETEDD